jgi:hypothetical protein
MKRLLSMNNEEHLKKIADICQVKEVKLAQACYVAIFAGLDGVITTSGNKYYVTKTKFMGLRKIETNLFVFLEQSPTKLDSEFSERARMGVKIMWIKEKKTDTYLARIEDGTLHLCNNRATTKYMKANTVPK